MREFDTVNLIGSVSLIFKYGSTLKITMKLSNGEIERFWSKVDGAVREFDTMNRLGSLLLIFKYGSALNMTEIDQ